MQGGGKPRNGVASGPVKVKAGLGVGVLLGVLCVSKIQLGVRADCSRAGVPATVPASDWHASSIAAAVVNDGLGHGLPSVASLWSPNAGVERSEDSLGSLKAGVERSVASLGIPKAGVEHAVLTALHARSTVDCCWTALSCAKGQPKAACRGCALPETCLLAAQLWGVLWIEGDSSSDDVRADV